jgi:two-component system chemotaxis sensor kinase CheA
LDIIGRRNVAKCLVLKSGGKRFALLIDEAIDTEQTLVNPLFTYLKDCLCYSGVTVLGNGNAIMILDADGIARLMDIEYAESAAVEEESAAERQVIVFRCSGAEYFALDTNEITRIETISARHLQEIGDADFINIAGETVCVVRPEDFAPVKKNDYTSEKLYILKLKRGVSSVGLLAGKVVDKIENTFKLSDSQICSDYVFGTSVFNEKILLFINPAAIAEAVETERQLQMIPRCDRQQSVIQKTV